MKVKNLMMPLLISTAFFANEAKSQTKSPVHIGIKGGANFSDLSLSGGNLNSKYSPGWTWCRCWQVIS